MKIIYKQILLLGLVVVSLFFASATHARKSGVEVTVTDPYVEMRTGPGRGYPVFHVVEKKDTLILYKRYTDWYKAKTNDGKEGYVKRDQLINTLGPDGNEIDFSRPGWQDHVNQPREFGVMAGDFSGASSLTAYIGYQLTHNIAAELKYTQTFSAVATNELYGINLRHQTFPQWRFSPYFLLGAGEITISPSSSLETVEDRQDSYMVVGGGLIFYASRQFLWKVEYNDYTILTTRDSNEEVDEWKAGFSIFF